MVKSTVKWFSKIMVKIGLNIGEMVKSKVKWSGLKRNGVKLMRRTKLWQHTETVHWEDLKLRPIEDQ